MNNANAKRRFEVEELEGTRKHRIVSKPHNKPFEYEVEERDQGWMVYMSNGNSLHVTKESEMIRLGFMRRPALVDTNTGEVVPDQYVPQSLKDQSRHKAAASTNKVMKRRAQQAKTQEVANV